MLTATIASVLLVFNALTAAPPVLAAGSSAPDITVDAWVKGDEVKAFDPDKVYLVEFWATWCGPCLATIPHLTALQTENAKDLVVIGVAASEKLDAKKDSAAPDDKSAEESDPKVLAEKMLANVKAFVTKQGDKMNYRVAFDGDGSMSRDWLRAAKQNTIPCAFIVKGGKIAWLGNPKDMDAPLAKALGKPAPKKKAADKPAGSKEDSAAGSKPRAPAKGAD